MEEHYEKETCSIAGSSADTWYDCLCASKGAGDTGKSEKGMVYAVEAGSAGEEAAKERDFSTIPFRPRQMP